MDSKRYSHRAALTTVFLLGIFLLTRSLSADADGWLADTPEGVAVSSANTSVLADSGRVDD